MKMSACLLAVAAGAALASSVSAQSLNLQAIDSISPVEYRFSADGTATVVDPGYSSRVVQNAYISGGGTAILGVTAIYDDARLSPFNGTLYPIVQLNTLIGVPAGTTETAATIRITFFDNHTNTEAPPSPASGQIGQPIDIDIPAGFFVPPATGVAGAGVQFVFPEVLSDDDRVGVRLDILNAGGTAPHPSLRPVVTAPAAITLGTSLGGLYSDLEPAGAPDGELDGPWVFNGAASSAVPMTLVVDFPAPPPASAVNLGTLAECAPNTRSLNVAAGEVKWFKITVPAAGVNAADLEALTIDTETPGSEADTVLALYDSRGNIVLVEDDDGSGALSQITLGIGRWAGPGDGLPYDGRNGDLPAGDYYLAVTTFGAGLFFEEPFTVTPGASAAATYNLNINYYTETCLPGLLAPTPDIDLGTIVAPLNFPPSNDVPTGTTWYKFNICTEISDPSKFLDIDFSPSQGDLVALIFDANGNEVAFSDDADADANDGIDYFLPQFSFGNVGPRPAGGLGALPLAGQDGTLPAGDYYMAVGGFPAISLPEEDSVAHGRFYFFGAAIDETEFSSPVFFTDVTEDDCANANPCPACAADYDQDGGITGSDLGAFFTDFEQGLPCSDVDLDGGVTGSDLSFFFSVFEAGGC